MSPDELKRALARLGLSMAAASERWRVPYRTIQNWCNGCRTIPKMVLHLIALETGQTPPMAA